MLVHAVAGYAVAAGDDRTTRIVSLVPSLTELVFALGAGDEIVGVSDYCYYPPEAGKRPHVGGLINPNTEAVLRTKPDVVLLYRSQADFAAKLGSLEISAETFDVDTLENLYSAITRLGDLTGQTTSAATLSQAIRDSLRAQHFVSKGARRPRGILIVSRDPAGLRSLYQASRANFLGQLFEAVGGELAIPDGPPLTLEAIIRANPDIIIDFSYAASKAPGEVPAGPRAYSGPWARLSTVRAVQKGTVYKWDDPHVLIPGPGVIDTAKKLRALLTRAEGQ